VAEIFYNEMGTGVGREERKMERKEGKKKEKR
jgi:hypothetical protein